MDINQIKKQAGAMQKQFMEAQASHADKEFEGIAGGGKVSVIIVSTGIGSFKVKKVNLDDELFKPENKDIVEDLIVAASNDAIKKAEEDKQNLFSNFADTMGLPSGFKLPF